VRGARGREGRSRCEDAAALALPRPVTPCSPVGRIVCVHPAAARKACHRGRCAAAS
jgi:hypothetical protein